MEKEKKKLFGEAQRKARRMEKMSALNEGFEENQRMTQLKAAMMEGVTQMEEITTTLGN